MQFIDIPDNNGGWFKPAEHRNAAAIVIQVQQYEVQRPTPNGPKDSALVDLTIFPTVESIQAGDPTELKGVRVEQTVLARDLKALVGGAPVLVRVDQVPAKKPGQNPAWVWTKVEPAVRQAVVEWGAKREAELEAAVAAAPSFDD